MRAREAFLVEFDHEMAATRRLLERVPAGALDWAPRDRSFTLGALATHLADLPHWGTRIVNHDRYDMATASGRPLVRRSAAEILAAFDTHVAEVRQALLARSDAELDAPWTLEKAGRTFLSMPRLAALRRFLLHHVIHHRGQLTVYLRLHDVPLPPLYGPSADEGL